MLIVTPYAGVWIEIRETLLNFIDILVTPYAGVWIEIKFFVVYIVFRTSHSLRGSVD